MASKRIMFTFDERSLQTLRQMTENAHYSSMADTVRDSLQLAHTLQEMARKGFTDVVVQNPETGAQRLLVIPRLIVEEAAANR